MITRKSEFDFDKWFDEITFPSVVQRYKARHWLVKEGMTTWTSLSMNLEPGDFWGSDLSEESQECINAGISEGDKT